MRFTFSALFALILAAPAAAQDDGLAGYWRFNIYEQGQPISFWLVHLDKGKGNKLIASAEPLKGALPVEIEDVKTTGDILAIKFKASFKGQQVAFAYEGRLPKPGAKKIFGSLTQGNLNVPAIMEATSAKTPFELDRETLKKMPADPRALVAIVDVIGKAKDNKVDAKDLQAWVNASLKTAELYGPRWQRTHNIQLLTALQGQKLYASAGVEPARRLGKQIDPKAPIDVQAKILSLAAGALRSGGDAKEADALDARLDKLETQAYAEHAGAKAEFKLTKFDGSKRKSKRAVLVELFTGAMCPPCVACDLAFDGVAKSYGPGEVVLLQYHMHVPRPEPMSNLDSDARFDYYAEVYPKKVGGTPTSLFNGNLDAVGGGSREDAPDKYKEFCAVVNRMLEAPAALTLSATAVRSGDKIAVTAKVANLDKPGDKIRLRIALVEDWVRFKGGNGMQYHHRVVRAMPGGVKGVAVKDKNFEHKAAIDLGELRVSLNKYLDESYEGLRPMRLRNLSVVAFVQDDASAEVLQAVNVPVADGK